MPFPISVQDVMSSPVHTTEMDTPASEAAATCFEQDIGSLVVLDGDDVVGIVTTQDMVEVLGTADEPGNTPVSEVMSAPVVTTTPRTEIRSAVTTMADHDIARLPVLDGEDLVGLVSTDDIIHYVPQVFHRHMREYETPEESHRYSKRNETAYEKPDWEVECTGLDDEELNIGDRVAFTKTISEQDVRTFAAASGDTNRLHLEDEFAAQTRFGRRIVHGTLVGGLISAALARLPGLTIYLSQDLAFLSAVDIGDRVTAVAEIVDSFGRDKYELTTDVFDEDGEKVIEGEATVLVDALPEAATVEVESLS